MTARCNRQRLRVRVSTHGAVLPWRRCQCRACRAVAAYHWACPTLRQLLQAAGDPC
ncbi:MAG: hypothetical protein EOO41_01480 [Methanobacteriota archaeon]|nr:MAG: hypothetical protein EOO41_01480 [Euryarchaeota archaeon]